jgi:hypothetical protein
LAAGLVVLPWSNGPIGKGDFVGYWSASRLLIEGRDPYDADALRTTQQQVYPERGYLVYTWNPPWLLVLLLPFAALPFQTATQLWLLSNTAVLLTASLWLWRLYAPDDRRGFWLAGLAGVLLPSSLAAIGAGQIVPWVLLASIAVLTWQQQNRYLGWAGTALSIMLLKPQVTFLAAALGAWHGLLRRQWPVFAGGAISVLGLLAGATVLYPMWLSSYTQNLTDRGLALWQTPTLGGLVLLVWPVSWLRYVGLIVLVAVPLLDRRQTITHRVTVPLAFGVALAPFGWSFDQILLLPMMLQLIAWNRRLKHRWLSVGLILLYAIPFAMRLAQVDEFEYVWVPWLTLGLYWIASRRAEVDRS